MRFVIEGFWTGYTSSQSRVVHRAVATRKFADQVRKVHKIIYTDGTALVLSVREAHLRERVDEKHQYDDLIRDAARCGQNIYRVADHA